MPYIYEFGVQGYPGALIYCIGALPFWFGIEFTGVNGLKLLFIFGGTNGLALTFIVAFFSSFFSSAGFDDSFLIKPSHS